MVYAVDMVKIFKFYINCLCFDVTKTFCESCKVINRILINFDSDRVSYLNYKKALRSVEESKKNKFWIIGVNTNEDN